MHVTFSRLGTYRSTFSWFSTRLSTFSQLNTNLYPFSRLRTYFMLFFSHIQGLQEEWSACQNAGIYSESPRKASSSCANQALLQHVYINDLLYNFFISHYCMTFKLSQFLFSLYVHVRVCVCVLCCVYCIAVSQSKSSYFTISLYSLSQLQSSYKSIILRQEYGIYSCLCWCYMYYS